MIITNRTTISLFLVWVNNEDFPYSKNNRVVFITQNVTHFYTSYFLTGTMIWSHDFELKNCDFKQNHDFKSHF